jgi:hypothetical protein
MITQITTESMRDGPAESGCVAGSGASPPVPHDDGMAAEARPERLVAVGIASNGAE